jgi:hypothetical protein
MTGEYVVSRLEGHPVQEYVSSLLYTGGPIALNGVTALLSAVAAFIFALILKKLGVKSYILGALTLAFVPVVYINSCNLMDYVWALAFVLGAVFALQNSKMLLAGILLGIGVGCRSTSILMILPLSILTITMDDKKGSVFALLSFWVSALLVSALMYLPYLITYGFELPPNVVAREVSGLLVVGKALYGVWGLLGLVGLTVATFGLVYALVTSGKVGKDTKRPKTFIAACIVTIIVYSVAFLRMPDESGYLIITLPFIIAILFIFVNRLLLIVSSAFIMLAPFFPLTIMPYYPSYNITNEYSEVREVMGKRLVISPGLSMLGYEQERRSYYIKIAEITLDRANLLPGKSVIVTGGLNNVIKSGLPGENDYDIRAGYDLDRGNVVFEWGLTGDECDLYLGDGREIYYLPGMNDANIESTGVDLRDYRAEELFNIDDVH